MDTAGFVWYHVIYGSGTGSTHGGYGMPRYGYGAGKPDPRVTRSKPYRWCTYCPLTPCQMTGQHSARFHLVMEFWMGGGTHAPWFLSRDFGNEIWWFVGINCSNEWFNDSGAVSKLSELGWHNEYRCRFQAGVLTSSVVFRNEEVGIVTIIWACFNLHPIIKGPSSWFLDFDSLVTNTYLWSMIHF